MSSNDNLFHEIEETQAILRAKGVFHQVKVYRREQYVYAAWGSGYVRLMGSGGTSKPDVSWEHLDTHKDIILDRYKLEFRRQ